MDSRDATLSSYDYALDPKRIAQVPIEPRHAARLLIVKNHRKDKISFKHTQVWDWQNELHPGDLVVLNDTRVFPARLYGQKEKTGAKIEVFLLRELNPELNLWDVLVDPARKIRVGNKLYFGDGELVAEVIDNTTSRGRTIRFIPDDSEKNFYDIIHEYGETPLPKEIKRKVDKKD